MAWDLCSSPPHPRLLLSSVGFVRLRRTLNEFSVLFIKTTIAKLLRNVIFFLFSFSFRAQTRAKEENRWEKNFATGFSRSFSSSPLARKKFFDEIFMWESRNDSESAWAVCATYIGETSNLSSSELSRSFSMSFSPLALISAYPKWNLNSRQH